jgi:hypothetical protein
MNTDCHRMRHNEAMELIALIMLPEFEEHNYSLLSSSKSVSFENTLSPAMGAGKRSKQWQMFHHYEV